MSRCPHYATPDETVWAPDIPADYGRVRAKGSLLFQGSRPSLVHLPNFRQGIVNSHKEHGRTADHAVS